MIKHCNGCDQDKPLSDFYTAGFYPSGKQRYQARCKDCHIAYQKKRYEELYNSDETFTRYYKTAHYRKYGLSLEDVELILARQNFRCAICGFKPDPEAVKRGDRILEVDHDHETDEVRGMLCRRCNDAIGKFEDDADLVLSAAAYLARAV